MKAATHDLEFLQRWLQTVITHPGGLVAGAASVSGDAPQENAFTSLTDIILPSRAMTSVERLEVYRHAYYARLVECLREFFPALSRTIGPEAFGEFAFGYLQKYPPRTYTLNQLADDFVRFLQETKPTDAEADEARWPNFLIDLARLEWTIEEVFDTDGNEDGSILTVESLNAISPEQWGSCRLILNPSLRLLAFQFPVNDFYSAFRQDDDREFPTSRESWLALYRRDFVVRRFELTLGQYHLLQAIRQGETLGQAIEKGMDASFTNLEDWVKALRNWFQDWTREQFFAGVVAEED